MRDSRNNATNYALLLLRYRSRSRKEMLERLRRKKFDTGQINSAMKYLENAGLIKDESVARELFRNGVERKYLGRKGIERFLSVRGIERNLIEETLAGHSGEHEKETALNLVRKKIGPLKKHPEHVIRRRLWGMLMRRGFSGSTAACAIKDILKQSRNPQQMSDHFH